MKRATGSLTIGRLQQRLFSRVEPVGSRHELGVALLFATFAAALVLWAQRAEIDEQIRTQATVIVSARSQVVQSVDGGVLHELAVREGDVVEAGQLLAVLNPARVAAGVEEISARALSLRAVKERLEAELADEPLRFSADIRRQPAIVRAETQLFERRRQTLRSDLNALEASLAIAEKELAALERLARTGDASATEVLRSQREVNELRAQITGRRNQYLQDAQAELARVRGELEQTLQILAQRREALASTRLFAPMAGVVNNIRYTTIGAVLAPGDELLRIVPSDEPLLVEAKVAPRDVGFVRRGLAANVKLDAFDHMIYGSFKGEVVYVSPDTVSASESGFREDPAYRVHVRIEPEALEARAGIVEVIPGMTATVEIITGRRTVAQYLLKPLRRTLNEALTER